MTEQIQKMSLQMEYIEQHFSGEVKFGAKCRCYIARNGSGISNLYIKFVLPDLPYGIHYKKILVYDLIKKIKLVIGGETIFKYNSTQLEILDRRNDKYDRIMKMCEQKNGIVFYPVDLSEIFLESNLFSVSVYNDKNEMKEYKYSRSNSYANNSIFASYECNFNDSDYHGLRLGNHQYHDVNFFIRIGDIMDLVEYSDDNYFYIKEKISKLDLIDASIFCNYQYGLTENKTVYNRINYNINQKMNLWIGNEEEIEFGNQKEYILKIPLNNMLPIEEMIVKMEPNIDGVKFCLVALDNKSIEPRVDRPFWHEEASGLMNLEYNFDHPRIDQENGFYGYDTRIGPTRCTDIGLMVHFDKEIDGKIKMFGTEINRKFKINYMFKIITCVIYKNGMCGVVPKPIKKEEEERNGIFVTSTDGKLTGCLTANGV